ncbi:thioesterase thiol ester dehydrase-isomerase [Suillus bovinus]|uniref:thioesterase thiol ester dehydrase-isomerase n=1 Tax=Suillus bovinus TaxID=48563 RepID=UPI001B87EE0E|nr:thioesterase thiol ester dehydrase-isomerase [Suillus bovinus]KAG2140253.1 thioesterase thiol ester dehydrase-isomerase [Suillus bovinus]
MSASLRFTRRVWKSFIDNKGHDAQCFPNLPGTVDFSLKIDQFNCTYFSLLFKGHYMTGVSTDIGASFVRPAGRTGDTLHARATLTAIGKSLAYTRVDFTNSTGDLVAYGYHTKYIGKSSSDPNNVKFSEDGEQVIEGNDVD